MAFGTNSKIFTAYVTDSLNNTAALDMNADTLTCALFDNTITPDQTVTSANTAYGAGVWASGEAANGGWTTGGLDLTVTTSAFSSNVYTLDADDIANSAGSPATITDTRGCLIYDNTLTTPVADQGVCFLAFGGQQSVTSGVLTVVFNASGLLTITV